MRLNMIQSSCLFKGIFPKIPRASNQQPPCHKEIPPCPLFLSLLLLLFSNLSLCFVLLLDTRTSKDWMPNSLGRVEDVGHPNQMGVWDAQRSRREGEEERAWEDLLSIRRWWYGCSRDLRGGPFK